MYQAAKKMVRFACPVTALTLSTSWLIDLHVLGAEIVVRSARHGEMGLSMIVPLRVFARYMAKKV